MILFYFAPWPVYYWQYMLDSGAVADAAEIAESEGIHRGIVNEMLRLALLSPDSVQAAIAIALSRTVTFEFLLRTRLPLDLGMQRDLIAGLG